MTVVHIGVHIRMKLTSYLQLSRHNIFVFRRRIPNDLKSLFGVNEYRLSLSTSNRKCAIRYTRIVANHLDELFLRLRYSMKSDKNNRDELLNLIREKKVSIKLDIQAEAFAEKLLDQTLDHKRQLNSIKAQHEREINLINNAAAAASEKSVKTISERSESIPKLSEVINEFMSEKQLLRRKDAPSTARKDRDSLNHFLNIIGDKLISDVSQADAATFSEKMLTHDARKLRQPNTINNAMSSISKFSRWVAGARSEYGHSKLDFTALRHKKVKRADEERSMFEQSELQKIFAHSLMQKMRTEKVEDFWLLHISLYSGMRSEEIALLNPNLDIYEDDGVWIFDINTIDGKRVKTKNSVRKVPIHDNLIKLGILDYVDGLKGLDTKSIFPSSIVSDGRFSKNIGKRVNRFIQVKVGIEGKSLHSFRHTIATALKRQLVNVHLSGAILGHEGGDITYDRYGKSYLPKTLKEVMDKVDFGISHYG